MTLPTSSRVRLTPEAQTRHPELSAEVTTGIVADTLDGVTRVIWGRGEVVCWIRSGELEVA
jgi:hypothetical protein